MGFPPSVKVTLQAVFAVAEPCVPGVHVRTAVSPDPVPGVGAGVGGGSVTVMVALAAVAEVDDTDAV